MIEKQDMRDSIFLKLFEYAKKDKNLVILTLDFGSPELEKFKKKFPKQYINVGICEQNAITIAAGLASEGKRVFVYSISSFIILRALEQIKLDICFNNNPITILGVGAGYAYDTAGPSHHSTEDVSIARSISGLDVYSPADNQTACLIIDKIYKKNKKNYIRLERGKYNNYQITKDNLNQGYRKFGVSKKSIIVTYGNNFHRVIKLCKNHFPNKKIAIMDLFKFSPLNKSKLRSEIKKFKNCLIVEEQISTGGISKEISEIIALNKMKINYGVLSLNENDIYKVGKRKYLNDNSNISDKKIIRAIKSFI